MASTDAKPVPQKNVAYRVTFPILDADGDLVTGASGLDSEVSKDGGTFADCTNEATEIATSSGVYYLDLTSTEMNADTVAVIVKTSSSGAKTTTIVMYPEEAGDIRVNVTQFGGTNGTFASGRPEVNTSHIAGSSVSTSSAQIGVNVVNAGGTAWGSGAITAASIASDAITAAKIANGAIDAATFAADVDAEILSYIVDDATRIDASALNTASVTTIPAILVDTAEIGAAGAGLTEAGGTGDHLTAVVWNAAWDAEVQSEVADALGVYDPPTHAELTSATANLDATVSSRLASASYTAPPSAATVADAVWDEAQADHVGAGTFGETATEIASILVDTGTTLDGKIDVIDGIVDAILLDTAEIGAAGAGLTALATAANLATVDTVVDAIKVKTDSLTFTVAGQVDANIQYVNDVQVNGDGSGTPWGP